MPTIILDRLNPNGNFTAILKELPTRAYFGRSETEAIGELVCGYPEMFGGINIERTQQLEKQNK